MNLKLYHGTSQINYEKIKATGFLEPCYLTSDDGQANYYAECASEEDGSNQVILVVEVNVNNLKADTNSYNEPLTHILELYDMSEEIWHESIENGYITYPKPEQWQISLDTAKSAQTKERIDFKYIFYDASLTDKDENLISQAIKMKSFTLNKKI